MPRSKQCADIASTQKLWVSGQREAVQIQYFTLPNAQSIHFYLTFILLFFDWISNDIHNVLE